ncbi:M1 family metallopeptidase [Nitrosomonas sp.]|uniref:M1 family metallopeptidase n=1 Tax=Nitrosomonas sp. TaxID=42353 RepID=UPI001D9FCCAF|nr:M1 family aminopeptidase [Nitrosomonas sp.]MBX3617441.1 M1 family peptidase [Nitrosomonas sp.]
MTLLALLRNTLLLILLGIGCNNVLARPAPFQFNQIEYDMTVTIDPVKRTLEGVSMITVERPRELQLLLDGAYEVTQAEFNDGPLGQGREQAGQPHIWNIPFHFRQKMQFLIRWHGVLDTLDTSLDHHQTLGKPIAVSGADGIFLPDGSNWYPRIAGELAKYKVKIELPPGYKGLVAGRLAEESDTDQGYHASFEFLQPAEGIDLMAGPYVIETQMYRNIKQKPVQLRTYFHPSIRDLADDYLEAVKQYLARYETQIGEYAYSEFSVVSSPTPTGFGMPTLTYLGIDVLKLPFIRHTSLGHEVLHNWWGNGIYPDYRSGNWSEGLTTFMADYAYQEDQSEEAAREMRLGWLRDFAALQPGQDQPLTAFTSRTHDASKIVGYNKAAMLFFMLRDQLGPAMFQRGLQGLWTTHRFKITPWSDLQKMFEIVSGQSLQPFFSQWLERAGAPAIAIASVANDVSDNGYELTLNLTQSEPAYQLQVPVVVETDQGPTPHRLDLQQTQQTFNLKLAGKPQAVLLDPDVRLFRRLASQEAPPILRDVMVHPATETLILSDKNDIRQLAATLAERLQRRTPKLLTDAPAFSGAPTLIIGLQTDVERWLSKQTLPPIPHTIAANGSAKVWTVARPEGATLAIVSATDAAALEALLRPLPHYGRQSYLAFDGRQVIEKGIWPMQVQRTMVE